MIDLTATIITFNEEENIRECLESLSWVPNIIVLDSGSTDRTVEIALEYTEHVKITDWPGHVEQKNRAIALASTDWIISVDADERISDELREEIMEHLQSEPTPSTPFMFSFTCPNKSSCCRKRRSAWPASCARLNLAAGTPSYRCSPAHTR